MKAPGDPRTAGFAMVALSVFWVWLCWSSLDPAVPDVGWLDPPVRTGYLIGLAGAASIGLAVLISNRMWERSWRRRLAMALCIVPVVVIFFITAPSRHGEHIPGEYFCTTADCTATATGVQTLFGIAFAAFGIRFVMKGGSGHRATFAGVSRPTGLAHDTQIIEPGPGAGDHFYVCACGRVGPARATVAEAKRDALAHHPVRTPSTLEWELIPDAPPEPPASLGAIGRRITRARSWAGDHPIGWVAVYGIALIIYAAGIAAVGFGFAGIDRSALIFLVGLMAGWVLQLIGIRIAWPPLFDWAWRGTDASQIKTFLLCLPGIFIAASFVDAV